MGKYLESIQSMDSVGTGFYEPLTPDSTIIIEVSGEAPFTTAVEPPTYAESISQDSVSYSAPQKVIVRTYRLRK